MFSWIYKSFAYHSLYLKFNESRIITLLIFVDDVFLVGGDIDEINVITNLLDCTFRIKNLGNLTYFLIFKIARSSKGIHMCQCKYILDILKEVGMLGFAPITTLVNFSKHKITNTGEHLSNPTPFRCLGRLTYITHT